MYKACFLVAMVCLPLAVQAENIKLLVQEYGPFTYTDNRSNEIQGVLTDKVIEIMKRAGVGYTISSTSLARGLAATMNDEDTCLFGFRRTPDREASFKWVGPLTTDNWVLYKRKSDTRSLKSFDEAKSYTIGSYRNAATGLQLHEQGYKIEFAGEDKENPRLLVNGREDYWIVSELHGMQLAQQQGYWNEISKAIIYKSIDLYMLCNNKMDKQRIDSFNAINKELDKDGMMDKLMHRYGLK